MLVYRFHVTSVDDCFSFGNRKARLASSKADVKQQCRRATTLLQTI